MKPHNINLDEFDNIFEWLFENEHEMHAAIYDRLEYAFENNKKKKGPSFLLGPLKIQ